MANRVWCRDAMVWKTDVGSADGSLSFNLLWKFRTGQGLGTGPDAAPLNKALQLQQPIPEGGRPVDCNSDMRAAGPTVLDTQIDITGARILRIRISYGLIFANPGPPAVGADFEEPVNRGWGEGLVVAPWQHASIVMPSSATSIGQPTDQSDAVAVDWIWWARKYVFENNTKNLTGLATTPATAVYSSIDTKNSRSINEYGSSLFWQVAPSQPTLSDPLVGATINGGVANWSILLELPG